MTEVQDIVNVLKDWRALSTKTVTKMLTHAQQSKNFKGEDIDTLLKGIT